jgi:glutathione S-transferase
METFVSDILLYSNPQSRGQIAHWMLEELGEPYDTRWIEYGAEMKSAEYLAVNPMGKVPAVTHKGKVITECPAICAYLAGAFPEKNLQPQSGDPALADYYRWLFFAAGPLEQAITMNNLKLETSEESSRTFGFGTYEATVNTLETALQNGPYICGEQFTAADVYVGSHVYWGIQFGTLEKRESFAAYAERLLQRPALQSMQALNQARMQETAS